MEYTKAIPFCQQKSVRFFLQVKIIPNGEIKPEKLDFKVGNGTPRCYHINM
jgi:hypothetical protein